MFDDILDIHFDRWAEGKGVNEMSLLNDDLFVDFFETRKNLFNKKHYEFMIKLKNGFSGYFEVLDFVDEDKIRLRNVMNNEIYEVISNLKPVKYDIIVSRIYEDNGVFKLLEELSFVVPYFLKNRLNFNQTPYQFFPLSLIYLIILLLLRLLLNFALLLNFITADIPRSLK